MAAEVINLANQAKQATDEIGSLNGSSGEFICSSVTYVTCTDGQLMGGANCQCRMKTVKVGNDTYCTASGKAPLVGGASCTEGQSTAGGCRCVLPLVDLPGGRCGKPTQGGACLEGQNIRQAGCTCNAPMKPIGDGSICGRDSMAQSAVAQAAAISKSQAVIGFSMDGSIVTANENFLKALGY